MSIHAAPADASAVPLRSANPGQNTQAPSLERRRVLGFKLAKATVAETVNWLIRRAQGQQATQVAFLNAHCANVARRDWRYSDTLLTADLVLPDGAGIALAAKLEGVKLGHNLNGTDLFEPLCDAMAQNEVPAYFLGGQPGIAESAARAAMDSHPGLRIVGWHHGFFAPRDEDLVIEEVNRSGARILFVAFGVPDQETWIARVRHRIEAPVILGVGGLLDFVSGRIPRAPQWMRDRGLEWVYRLKCEPRRMWKRYLLGNLSFMGHTVLHCLRKRLPQFGRSADKTATRALDVIFSAAGLAFLAPALAAFAIAIRLESRGPALYKQMRVGLNGDQFELVKFRSMRTDRLDQAELRQTANDRDDGVTFKLKQDPRVTKIGRFIRKYSIDELPQLWNVLKGEMSLVGPRPALPSEVECYTQSDRRRLAGKPGITCTWQISGRADLPFDRQVRLDIDYLRGRSVWVDLGILMRTPWAVISARGAY